MASWWLNSKKTDPWQLFIICCCAAAIHYVPLTSQLVCPPLQSLRLWSSRMAFVSPNLRPRFLFFVNGGREFLSTIFGSVWKCLVCMSLMWWLQQMVIARTWIFLDARYSYDVSQKNCNATWWWTIIHALQMKGNDENWDPASFPRDTQLTESSYFDVT